MRTLASVLVATAVASIMVVSAVDPNKDYTPVIPNKTIVKTVVADLLLPYSVADQWKSVTAQANYAWDYDRNCFAETIYFSGETYTQRVTCKNYTGVYTKASGKCSIAKDATTKVQTLIEGGFITRFNVYEGIVADPFLGKDQEFYLWKNAAENQWLWVRTTDRAVVYFQEYRTDLKKVLVYYVYSDKGIV